MIQQRPNPPCVVRPGPLGLTLLELLVVLAIISLLMALGLPAVQAARERARRLHCAANLQQIGIALSAYAASHGQFPAGRLIGGQPRVTPFWPHFGRPVHAALLPYLGSGAVFDAMNFSQPLFWSLANHTAQLARPANYLCPSEISETVIEVSTLYFDDLPQAAVRPQCLTNYAFLAGTREVSQLAFWTSPAAQAESDGVFNDHTRIRPADVTDGLAKTVFVSERGLGFVNQVSSTRIGYWFYPHETSVLATAYHPPNSVIGFTPPQGLSVASAPSSYHPGGVNALMGDGSVHFIAETIESWEFIDGAVPDFRKPRRWQAMATRAGND